VYLSSGLDLQKSLPGDGSLCPGLPGDRGSRRADQRQLTYGQSKGQDRFTRFQERNKAESVGAGGGDRTHTPLRAWDFKSHASASSATPASL
jgi:hypothetical protein